METPAPTQGRRKILFLTNSDRGEFGVVIATAQAMLEVSPADIELHIGTYAGVEELIAQVSDESVRLNPQAVPITYHNIAKSAAYLDTLALLKSRNIETKPLYLPMSYLRKPSFSNTLQAIQDTASVLVPMDGPKMERIVLQALEIIGAVKPDFIVINSVMAVGLTAAVHSKIPSCILSPNSIKDLSSSLQPYGAVFWKFPSLFSGFSYPIPWHLKPVNALYVLWAAKVVLFDDHLKAVEQHLKASSGITLQTLINLLHNKIKGMQILVSTLPELDFPLTIPKHIHPCGPIIGRWRPIGESDPELTQWLSRGPTMYINLGSLCLTDEDQALEMAGAIKLVLDRARQEPGMEALQAIWKLKKYGEYDTEGPKCAMYDVLGPEMEAGLVRIEKWFIPEPLSILQSGHIACSVHHGGANSFNEAVMSGLPQVVLPPWTDCYDYAQRAELHGLGRWGSKESNPQWASRELADAMSWCLFGETARVCRQKTKNMAALVESRGRGAVKAAEFIIRQVEANAKAAQGHA